MIWWAVLGCSSGPCKDGELKKIAAALGTVEPKLHQQLAAKGIQEACTLPPAVEKGLGDVAGGWPERVPMFDMRVAADAPDVWTAACPGGTGVLAEAASMAEVDKRKYIWAKCDLQRHDWAEKDFAKADGAIVLPIVLLHLLEDETAFDKSVAIQAIAGL